MFVLFYPYGFLIRMGLKESTKWARGRIKSVPREQVDGGSEQPFTKNATLRKKPASLISRYSGEGKGLRRCHCSQITELRHVTHLIQTKGITLTLQPGMIPLLCNYNYGVNC